MRLACQLMKVEGIKFILAVLILAKNMEFSNSRDLVNLSLGPFVFLLICTPFFLSIPTSFRKERRVLRKFTLELYLHREMVQQKTYINNALIRIIFSSTTRGYTRPRNRSVGRMKNFLTRSSTVLNWNITKCNSVISRNKGNSYSPDKKRVEA